MSAPALHHLALRTRDLPRLQAFYRHWLGLEVVREQLPRSLWLRLGQGAVLMIEAAEPQEPFVPEGTKELVAFAIDAEQRSVLREALLREGMLEGETEHTLYTRDPDGRRVGFSTYPLP